MPTILIHFFTIITLLHFGKIWFYFVISKVLNNILKPADSRKTYEPTDRQTDRQTQIHKAHLLRVKGSKYLNI